MKKIFTLSALAMVSLLTLWLVSLCCSIRLTFGVVPHDYIVEARRGTVTVESWFTCVRSAAPRVEIGSAERFDQQFYEEWGRVVDRRQFCGIIAYEMQTAICPETTALDPTFVSTPGTLVA